MNENTDKLRELKDDLEQMQRFHGEILAKEPTIARPLDQAVSEARRRYKMVGELDYPPQSEA